MRHAALAVLAALAAAPALAAPDLVFRGAVALDLRSFGADNDRQPEPGETFDLALTIGNEGDIGARALRATLASSDPLLTVAPAPPDVSFPDAPRDALVTNAVPHFRLTAGAGLPCGKAVRLDLGVTYTDDLGNPFSATLPFLLFIGEKTLLAYEDFDTGPGGWRQDSASTGSGTWVNAWPDPYTVGPDLAQPDRDASYPDVSCFYTAQSITDVDGGSSILRSQTWDLAGRSNVWLSWQRFFFTDDASSADAYAVRISNDAGLSWTDVERINARANTWVPVAYRVDTLLPMTSSMMLQILVEDNGLDSTAEGAVDDLSFLSFACGPDAAEAVLDSTAPTLDDSIDPLCTDRDQVPDAGETVDFAVRVVNSGTSPAVNATATLAAPLPPELTLLGPATLNLGTLADNGGAATATFRLQVAATASCRTPIALTVSLAADPPARGTPRSYPFNIEEDVNEPLLRWFDDFDSGLADWSIVLYGLVDDWGPGVKLEDCAKNPGSPPTPARKFWFTGSTGVQTDCSVTYYTTDIDSAIRSPRIDTGFARPLLLDLRWNQLLTLTPGEADYAEVWIDHDDDGAFTRLVRQQGQVTTNGDTLDPAGFAVRDNPDLADVSLTSRFVQLEFRFRSDPNESNNDPGQPLALGWIVDNVELTWTDANGRTCDSNTCSSCQSNPTLTASKTQACAGEDVTLDGAGSTLTGCPAPGVPVFEWFKDAAPYTSGPSSIVVTEPAAANVDWRLEVSCSTLPGCRASASQRVLFVDCPNCSASAQLAPAPAEECAGTAVPLDATASTVTNCPAPGVKRYTWYRNSVSVGSGPGYTALEPVAGTYDYMVEVYCSSDPACKSQLTHSILFKPDGTPRSLGNELRARKAAPDVELLWLDAQPLAVGWQVDRASLKTGPWSPFATPGRSYLDLGALTAPPDRYHYLARAVSCSGIVGP